MLDDSKDVCVDSPNVPNMNYCENWKTVVNFFFDVAEKLDIDSGDVKVGLLLFSDSIRLQWTMSWWVTTVVGFV